MKNLTTSIGSIGGSDDEMAEIPTLRGCHGVASFARALP
jgi:hypothetical protein